MATPDAAVAIVHTRGASGSVLLMRRAERETDPWSGHWAFPGGRCAPYDSDLLATALRELEEECGMRLERGQLETAMPFAVARRGVGRYLLVAPFVLCVDAEHRPALDAQEAAEAAWVPLAWLRDPARHGLRNVAAQPSHVRFPGIDLNGVPLWGFTYRLITEWLGLNPREGMGGAASYGEARALLDGLVAHGCLVSQDWQDSGSGKVAAVRGAIPVALANELVSRPADHIPRVNMVEVLPAGIRMVGLGFEEYSIKAEH